MVKDPFSFKKYSKASPVRLAYTAYARFQNFRSGLVFERSALPWLKLEDLPPLPDGVNWEDTSVTHEQMQHLLKGLEDTKGLPGSAIEIGCFRGVTTRCLSRNAERPYFAVDPFIGHGALESDFQTFLRNIEGLENVQHVRGTSGQARSNWAHGQASFLFIDAVHDYVNTAFDIQSWVPLVVPGGIVAFHDTDDGNFPGTRRAVHEFLRSEYEIYAHPHNLTMVRMPL